MNIERQQQVFDETIEKMRSIMFKKGNDYSNQDRLSNFKLAGGIVGSTAELNCLNLIATKVARLGVLLNSNSLPNNESIEDSIIDLGNYTLLLQMIRAERNECKVIPAASSLSRIAGLAYHVNAKP
jgi:hypothetical protein